MAHGLRCWFPVLHPCYHHMRSSITGSPYLSPFLFSYGVCTYFLFPCHRSVWKKISSAGKDLVSKLLTIDPIKRCRSALASLYFTS